MDLVAHRPARLVFLVRPATRLAAVVGPVAVAVFVGPPWSWVASATDEPSSQVRSGVAGLLRVVVAYQLLAVALLVVPEARVVRGREVAARAGFVSALGVSVAVVAVVLALTLLSRVGQDRPLGVGYVLHTRAVGVFVARLPRRLAVRLPVTALEGVGTRRFLKGIGQRP